MRSLTIAIGLLLALPTVAQAKPVHCKHGYVRHGHRCVHRSWSAPVSAPQSEQTRLWLDEQAKAAARAQEAAEGAARLAAFQAAQVRNATLIAEQHNPPPPPTPAPRPRGSYQFTPGAVSCDTAGQPAGKCLLTVAEAHIVATGGPPYPLYVSYEVIGEAEAPEAHYTSETIGSWNPHPWAPVSTEWWAPHRQPIYREEDKGIEASPLEANAVYVGTGELGGAVVLR